MAVPEYAWTILFYSTIILLLFIFRKKFDVQHRFLAMYRTKVGLKLMNKIGTKHSETVKFLGYIGIGAGYIGLFTIVIYLLKNLVKLLTVPAATSAVSVVIPGVRMPGSAITIPLITGWIALFLVILVHEFSHGLLARAHKIPVKASGIFFLGPLMGAFVEPEEKKLRKSSDTAQYSVYAAGPFSNILLALLCLFCLTYLFAPGLGAMEEKIGIRIVDVTEGFPAQEIGMQSGMIINSVDGESVKSYPEFLSHMQMIRPDESVNIGTDKGQFIFKTVQHPDDPKRGYIGVMASTQSETVLVNDTLLFKLLHTILSWFGELFAITGLLSLGIGLANLLPLGPVDGGRMLQVTLEKIKGVKKGNVLWRKISVATLFLLLINIFWPAIKWFGGLFV